MQGECPSFISREAVPRLHPERLLTLRDRVAGALRKRWHLEGAQLPGAGHGAIPARDAELALDGAGVRYTSGGAPYGIYLVETDDEYRCR